MTGALPKWAHRDIFSLILICMDQYTTEVCRTIFSPSCRPLLLSPSAEESCSRNTQDTVTCTKRPPSSPYDEDDAELLPRDSLSGLSLTFPNDTTAHHDATFLSLNGPGGVEDLFDPSIQFLQDYNDMQNQPDLLNSNLGMFPTAPILGFPNLMDQFTAANGNALSYEVSPQALLSGNEDLSLNSDWLLPDPSHYPQSLPFDSQTLNIASDISSPSHDISSQLMPSGNESLALLSSWPSTSYSPGPQSLPYHNRDSTCMSNWALSNDESFFQSSPRVKGTLSSASTWQSPGRFYSGDDFGPTDNASPTNITPFPSVKPEMNQTTWLAFQNTFNSMSDLSTSGFQTSQVCGPPLDQQLSLSNNYFPASSVIATQRRGYRTEVSPRIEELDTIHASSNLPNTELSFGSYADQEGNDRHLSKNEGSQRKDLISSKQNSQSKGKRRADAIEPQRQIIFVGPNGPPQPKAKRAKFAPERRKEVANVRDKGSCMRCKYLEIRVSQEPCALLARDMLIFYEYSVLIRGLVCRASRCKHPARVERHRTNG